MALRRPPTRIELKTDDMEEYNEILIEREKEREKETKKLKKEQPSKRNTKYASPSKSKFDTNKLKKADRIGIGSTSAR